MRRKERIEVKRGKKRVKIALIFLALLMVISLGGFFLRSYRYKDLDLFFGEQILRPVTNKSPEGELAEELKKIDLRVISVSITGEKDLEASISGGTKIIFKTEKIAQQASSLQVILARFKIEGQIPKKIDLRFEKPIVVF